MNGIYVKHKRLFTALIAVFSAVLVTVCCVGSAIEKRKSDVTAFEYDRSFSQSGSDFSEFEACGEDDDEEDEFDTDESDTTEQTTDENISPVVPIVGNIEKPEEEQTEDTTEETGVSTTEKQTEESKTTTEKTTKEITESKDESRTVYITPTGKRYHFSSSCGGKNSYDVTLNEAEKLGLTPCQKCVG